jgi:hypothetical protein
MNPLVVDNNLAITMRFDARRFPDPVASDFKTPHGRS